MLDVYYQSSAHLHQRAHKSNAIDAGRDVLTEAYKLRRHNLNSLSVQGGFLKPQDNAEKGGSIDFQGGSTMPSITSNKRSSIGNNLVQRTSAGTKSVTRPKKEAVLNSDMQSLNTGGRPQSSDMILPPELNQGTNNLRSAKASIKHPNLKRPTT